MTEMVERVARALHEVADLRSAKDCRVAWDNCLPAYREMLFVDARAAIEAMQPAIPAAEQRGEARERERCAKVAEEIAAAYGEDETGWFECCETLAAAIRKGTAE